MPLISINDPGDPRICAYSDLRNKRLAIRKGKFIAEGDLVVRRLLASDFEVESLLVAENQIDRLELPNSITVYHAPLRLIETIAGFRFHRGILGCGIRRPQGDLEEMIPPVTQDATIVVCSAVQDPENLGGIFRNCAAFGVDLVVIGNHSADPLARRVLRVSMATVLKLNVYESPQLPQDLTRLRDQFAIHFSATVLDPQAQRLASSIRPARLGLVFGNELNGLDESLARICCSRLTIPMCLQTDSLNVAVASGIFLYHFRHMHNDCGLA